MNRKQIAVNYFERGFNCAQSVLLSFNDIFHANEETLVKASCGFGGGMGRLQETCGTLTGAYLAIGMQVGNHLPEDNDAKELTYKLVRDCNAEFKKRHQVTTCRELLNCNLQTEEGKAFFTENNLKEKVCCKCIEDAVKIVESIFEQNK